MRVTYRKSFSRDLKKVKDRAVLERIRRAIEHVEAAAALHEIRDLKK